MANRLGAESSPYLRQHAENPVDWYPWGPEALEQARSEDRPILLSVGYSACHWCHVMEHESFADPETAEVMNEAFVSIKVDREERPDIDQIYMKAVQAMTGSGGWPLTVFLTPEGVPYYGGTYFPPEPRHGMPSFRQVLRAAADAYTNRQDDVRAAGAKLLEALARSGEGSAGVSIEREAAVEGAVRALAARFDEVHGGFGQAPKFPQPVTLELLMRRHLRGGDGRWLHMAVHTLRRMAAGGMRDHLGGGFHRYSVDARWLVPHFEKMLYDNALLARAYIDAYRLTGDDDLRLIAEEILDYVAADLRAPEGGFWSARDADSEGEEGTFYVWTPDDVHDALPDADARLFCRLYDVTPQGNFEGKSILHLPHEPASVAAAEGLAPDEIEDRMAAARSTLAARRGRREPPFRDEKVLTSWSAMAIRAFAEVGATVGRWDLVASAIESSEFIWDELRVEGRLLRVHMDGTAKVPAFLEDYAALGNALLSLHAATLDPRWLERARTLAAEMIDLFRDTDTGLFYDSAHDAEALVLRPRDPMDNATPSGNSLAAEFLARLGHIFDDADLRAHAEGIVAADSEMLARYGPAFGRMLSVADRLEAEPLEVAIFGPDEDGVRELIQAAHSIPHRNLTIVGATGGAAAPEIPLVTGRAAIDDRPTAYVCRSFACKLPVHDAAGVEEQMTSS